MKTFKRHERAVAAILGGRRVGNSGRNTEDVAHDWLSVECKSRRELPAWLLDAMHQAERNAPADGGRLPVVVLHQDGGRVTSDLVVMRLSAFVDWFGDDPMAAASDEDLRILAPGLAEGER